MNRLQEKAENLSLGIYLHVPFCARSCDFCNFYQEAPDRKLLDRYLAGIERELALWPPDRPVDTIFWGGGTPGLLAPKDLERLGKSLISVLPNRPSEWSVEMAPSTVTADRLTVLRDLGVNRISVGVQSFQADLLERLGRIHSLKRVYEAIETLHQCDFANFNLDLIFAIPGQSLPMWEADLAEAVRMDPAHLSTYCLTFEEDTALWVKLNRGIVDKFKIEDEADYYERAWSFLDQSGYAQYEISNFAKPGFECRHNINTWRMHEWLAYGPSASAQWKSERFTREPSLERWLAGIENQSPVFSDRTALTSTLLAGDALIFGLRMNQGVHLEDWKNRFHDVLVPREFYSWKENLIRESLAEERDGYFRLTLKGRLLADRIGEEVLDFF